MKKSLLLLIGFWSIPLFSQSVNIQEVIVTAQNDGINVNLKTITFNGAGFLSSGYTVTNNVVNLDVCFWFDVTLPVLTFYNNFQIPLENEGSYTLNVTVHNSLSNETCDYYSVGATYTTEFLSTGEIPTTDTFSVFPNPVTDKLHFSQSVSDLNIFDITGRLVKFEANAINEITLDDLPNGVYLVSAQHDKEIINKKIIIRK